MLKDVDLKIGWGKAVVLPPIPLYTGFGNPTLNAMIAKAKAVVAQAAPAGQVPPPGWTTNQGPVQREINPHEGKGTAIPLIFCLSLFTLMISRIFGAPCNSFVKFNS